MIERVRGGEPGDGPRLCVDPAFDHKIVCRRVLEVELGDGGILFHCATGCAFGILRPFLGAGDAFKRALVDTAFVMQHRNEIGSQDEHEDTAWGVRRQALTMAGLAVGASWTSGSGIESFLKVSDR